MNQNKVPSKMQLSNVEFMYWSQTENEVKIQKIRPTLSTFMVLINETSREDRFLVWLCST